MKFLTGLILLCSSVPLLAADDPKATVLAAKAALILERNCLQCHRGAGSASKSKFDVRDVDSMLDAAVVIEGEPEGSLLWKLGHRGTMPPRSQPQLPRLVPADAQVVFDWIKAGAPKFPAPQARSSIKFETTLQKIAADLQSLPDTRTRARQRYFSLVEMYNTPTTSEESLHLARAALSKALNSLSWRKEIVLPRAVDETQTIYAVDIERLGWTREHWLAVRSQYPYAVGFANLKDKTLLKLDETILGLTGLHEPQYLVRADWFTAMALQPALYHPLLYDLSLPELTARQADKAHPNNLKRMTAVDLERFLNVDVIANLLGEDASVQRSGFTSSGVSEQNRLLERHVSKVGSYWKSYDFKAHNRRGILSQFPLGPKFPENPSPQLAFDHDGGEIIFQLPNGLQGYLLVDAHDQRIDAGPIDVVSDALRTAGTPAIVTGLSCMSCHRTGMINPPADEIRDFARVFGRSRERIERLHPAADVFESKLDEDSEVFMAALEKTVGPLLKIGDDAKRNLRDFPEPVSEVARHFLQQELDLAAIAAELHETDIKRLKARIEGDELLQNLGLGVLLRADGKIKRALWESTQGGTSVMQLAAYSLDYTTPQFKE